jgi:hypothetical protein
MASSRPCSLVLGDLRFVDTLLDSQTETAAAELVDTDLLEGGGNGDGGGDGHGGGLSDEQTEPEEEEEEETEEEEMETEEVYIVCKNSCLTSQLCGVTAEGLLTFEHYYCLECGGGVEIKSAFPSKFRGVVIAVIPADDVVNAIMPSVD